MPLYFPPIKNPPVTANTFAFVGDSRVAAQFADASTSVAYPVNPCRIKSNAFFFNVANALLGQRMKTVYNGGISGYRSDQYLANLPAAIASGAKWLCLWGVVNDIGQYATTGDTELSIWTRIKNATLQALSAGMNVLLLTEPGTNSFGGNATQTAMVFQFNEYMREFADVTPNVYVFDIASYLVDPAQTNLTLRSAYTSDGTHPHGYGGYYLGVQFANYISPFVPPIASQIYSPAEIPGNGNLQQLSNPLFLTTTGGTSGSGITGNTPASYSSYTAAGSSATISTAADSSGYGNAVTITGTFTAANQTIGLSQDTILGNYTIPGDIVDSGVEITVAAGAVNLAQAALWTNFGDNGNPTTDLYAWPYVALPGVAMDYVLRSVPFKILSGTTWASWNVRFIAAGAGSFTATIKRPWMRRRFAS